MNQVDPKQEKMEMWSPYASNYDNPIRFNDFLGDEPGGPGDRDRRDGINTGPGDADYYYREDNKGAIVSSSPQDYDQNPIKAAPIDGSPELTPQQQKFVDNFKEDIRKTIKQIGKWFNYNSK
jgi:hypothetical protein